MAEYFRDEEGQDVLLFIDNIFRFTQANSEVSALLGRIPSAVGYQPTLATDLGMLQERITTTTKGSITSVQVRIKCCFARHVTVCSIPDHSAHRSLFQTKQGWPGHARNHLQTMSCLDIPPVAHMRAVLFTLPGHLRAS